VGALDMAEPGASMVRDQLQRVYTSLCMAKHANPLLSMEHGLRVLSDGAYFVRGPDVSRPGVKNSCFALVHAVSFGIGVAYIFVKHCSSDGLRARPQDDALKMWGRVRELEDVLADLMTPQRTEPK